MEENNINLEIPKEHIEGDKKLTTRHGQVEFITVTKYLDEYLNKDSKMLELGAGKGRYSIYYARNGYDVTSVEFVPNNLEILKSKITPNMKIEATQGDSVDLSEYEDNTFDLTFANGALHHLYDDEDVDNAIKEAIRVTKKGGIIAFSYITTDSLMINWALKDHHLIDGYGLDFDENFKMKNFAGCIYGSYNIQEFKDKFKNHPNTKMLHNVATDGMSNILKETVDNLEDKEFKVWVGYHLESCEKEELQGYSNHMLYICQKLSD